MQRVVRAGDGRIAADGGILGAIERQDHDVFAGRAHLGLLRKLARIPTAMRLARLEHGDHLADIF
jgi:hypothetical protein